MTTRPRRPPARLVPIICRGGPLDGEVYEMEAPFWLVPDCSLDEPGWFSHTPEPKVAGQGFYMVITPTEMEWVPEPRTP